MLLSTVFTYCANICWCCSHIQANVCFINFALWFQKLPFQLVQHSTAITTSSSTIKTWHACMVVVDVYVCMRHLDSLWLSLFHSLPHFSFFSCWTTQFTATHLYRNKTMAEKSNPLKFPTHGSHFQNWLYYLWLLYPVFVLEIRTKIHNSNSSSKIIHWPHIASHTHSLISKASKFIYIWNVTICKRWSSKNTCSVCLCIRSYLSENACYVLFASYDIHWK